jgi:hypothetical protein
MYSHGQRPEIIGVPGTPTSFTTTGIKGANTCLPIYRPWLITGVAVTITTAITVTSAIATVKYRPTPGSATGEVSLGTITLPVTGSAIGKQYWKKLTPYRALPGGELVLDVTQAATAGAGVVGLICGETTEIPGNVTNMVESA